MMEFFKKVFGKKSIIQEDTQAKRLAKVTTLHAKFKYLKELSKNLQSPVKAVVLRIIQNGTKLLEDNISDENLSFMIRYIPHAVNLVEAHVRYRLHFTNDLKFFYNVIESKDILIRLATALADKHEEMTDRESDSFSADIKALDSMLRMRGH